MTTLEYTLSVPLLILLIQLGGAYLRYLPFERICTKELRSQLAKSDADYDLAVAGYNQALVAALHEVTDAVQAARSLDAQIASATQARDAAESALKLADTRYQAGLGTQLDVLSAQRPLLQLEQQLAALRARRYAATVDLDRALGGGLAPVGPGAAAEPDSNPDLAGAPTP